VINLYPWPRIVGAIAVIYAAVIAIIAIVISLFIGDIAAFRILSIAISGGTILQLILYLCVYFLWEKLWEYIPSLNTLIFPNLNGSWDMRISYLKDDKTLVTIRSRAVIKQNLLDISIETESDDSHSITIVAIPKKEPGSQTPGIYYTYRVIPDASKYDDRPSYLGSAHLRYTTTGFTILKGNYYTDRKTKGTFEMLKH